MVWPRLKIVGLGDSTTAGTPGFLSPLESPPSGQGNPESQYAYWMMKAHPVWIVLNRGINGQRSEQILSRFKRDVLSEKPDCVIILAGVNDVYQGHSIESVEKNLLSMYKMAIDAGIVVIAATILPYDIASKSEAEKIASLNQWIERVAEELGILFCDTHATVADPSNPNKLSGSPDEIHPDAAGYRKMGEALSKVIEGHYSKKQ